MAKNTVADKSIFGVLINVANLSAFGSAFNSKNESSDENKAPKLSLSEKIYYNLDIITLALFDSCSDFINAYYVTRSMKSLVQSVELMQATAAGTSEMLIAFQAFNSSLYTAAALTTALFVTTQLIRVLRTYVFNYKQDQIRDFVINDPKFEKETASYFSEYDSGNTYLPRFFNKHINARSESPELKVVKTLYNTLKGFYGIFAQAIPICLFNYQISCAVITVYAIICAFKLHFNKSMNAMTTAKQKSCDDFTSKHKEGNNTNQIDGDLETPNIVNNGLQEDKLANQHLEANAINELKLKEKINKIVIEALDKAGITFAPFFIYAYIVNHDILHGRLSYSYIAYVLLSVKNLFKVCVTYTDLFGLVTNMQSTDYRWCFPEDKESTDKGSNKLSKHQTDVEEIIEATTPDNMTSNKRKLLIIGILATTIISAAYTLNIPLLLNTYITTQSTLAAHTISALVQNTSLAITTLTVLLSSIAVSKILNEGTIKDYSGVLLLSLITAALTIEACTALPQLITAVSAMINISTMLYASASSVATILLLQRIQATEHLLAIINPFLIYTEQFTALTLCAPKNVANYSYEVSSRFVMKAPIILQKRWNNFNFRSLFPSNLI